MTSPAARQHRMHALCPYFAMFPPAFAREAVLKHSKPGDLVLDPFCGRGTAPLEALLNGRRALAGDINPVAYCVTAGKTDTPQLATLQRRLAQLEKKWKQGQFNHGPQTLTPYFRRAFARSTLSQILFLRRKLAWRRTKTDRFLAAMVLGSLHGESLSRQHYLSAQMPHSISTKPGYQLRYWKSRGIRPPKRDVFAVLRDRCVFRFSDGSAPNRGRTILTDARKLTTRVRTDRNNASLIVTSPPYLDVTSFEEDQWLRLWFLGGPPYPRYGVISPDDRHRSETRYWTFLRDAWQGIRGITKSRTVLVCRIGARRLSVDALVAGLDATLRASWASARHVGNPVVTQLRNRQATVWQKDSIGCRIEVDLTYALQH